MGIVVDRFAIRRFDRGAINDDEFNVEDPLAERGGKLAIGSDKIFDGVVDLAGCVEFSNSKSHATASITLTQTNPHQHVTGFRIDAAACRSAAEGDLWARRHPSFTFDPRKHAI